MFAPFDVTDTQWVAISPSILHWIRRAVARDSPNAACTDTRWVGRIPNQPVHTTRDSASGLLGIRRMPRVAKTECSALGESGATRPHYTGFGERFAWNSQNAACGEYRLFGARRIGGNPSTLHGIRRAVCLEFAKCRVCGAALMCSKDRHAVGRAKTESTRPHHTGFGQLNEHWRRPCPRFRREPAGRPAGAATAACERACVRAAEAWRGVAERAATTHALNARQRPRGGAKRSAASDVARRERVLRRVAAAAATPRRRRRRRGATTGAVAADGDARGQRSNGGVDEPSVCSEDEQPGRRPLLCRRPGLLLGRARAPNVVNPGLLRKARVNLLVFAGGVFARLTQLLLRNVNRLRLGEGTGEDRDQLTFRLHLTVDF
ncbi:Protein of unknown function [Gryllus bimaculatus]|nr:Protein of unknown function [Gryllus bimaculatus]